MIIQLPIFKKPVNSQSCEGITPKSLIFTGLLLPQLIFSLSANAGLVVDISTATAGNSQDYKNTSNHIIGNQPGYFGANLYTDNSEITAITVEFLGSQAKWEVWFTLNSDDDAWTIFNHPNDAYGVVQANAANLQQATLTMSANQLLDFTFFIDDQWRGSGADWSVVNGSNGKPTSLDAENSGAYFWTGFEYNEAGAIEAVLLGLDDGGNAYDEDHDDLMIRLTGFGEASLRAVVQEVPLPPGAGLFLSALGLSFVLRRKAD